MEILSSLTSLWPGIGAFATAVAVVVGGMVVWLLSTIRSGAKAEAGQQISEAGLKALKRMQQAEAKGARDRDAVIKQMDEGKF